MKSKKLVYALVIVAVAIIGWAAFRPERLFLNAKVNESLPTASRSTTNTSETIVASGSFHDVAHKGVGRASIYQLPDGKRILRFTNFETSNGPDVRVYLVAANEASDSETVKKAGFVEVGALKGNIGDQNYELGSDVDLAKYRAVTIWCKRFGVNFATAPLSTAEPMAAVNQ
jgi:Electron transfer DM13